LFNNIYINYNNFSKIKRKLYIENKWTANYFDAYNFEINNDWIDLILDCRKNNKLFIKFYWKRVLVNYLSNSEYKEFLVNYYNPYENRSKPWIIIKGNTFYLKSCITFENSEKTD